MQAISFAAPKQVGIINIPEPRLGPQDVLVDVHYIGCAAPI
jgi:NADPH:quinone reductase-like Zn-dependent oxidoreductase